jgi:serine/threonine-protein kinase HipA
MGRRSHTRALNAWMNGILVGEWRVLRNSEMEFHYAQTWLDNRDARRPLSLSLPLPLEGMTLRGSAVANYFDNLLPDSDQIRRRVQSRFHTESQDAFDLLAATGRDCVGAIQLLPPGDEPMGVKQTQVVPLTDAEVGQGLLQAVTSTGFAGQDDEDDFRISIAGAQEKTAFTWHQGRWCRPRGSTPTTHIFKLPLGLVGARQADMRTSVENEWLCSQLLTQFGIPVPKSEVHVFGEQKVLVVERFDRRYVPEQDYWLRIPQEDFCQVSGAPSTAKYERDGGPGMKAIAQWLQAAENSEADLDIFMRTQILFWMLAATDGHAKNFSITLQSGGRFRLTPIYDVLSVWPIVGAGPNKLDYQEQRMAMAWEGDRNRHYRLRDIQRRHLLATAKSCGYGARIEDALHGLVEQTPKAIDKVASQLPANFPMDVFESITEGLRKMSNLL